MKEKSPHKSCSQCGQKHDEQLDEMTDLAILLAGSFSEIAFPELWKEAKEDIKELSKREIAEQMFYTGAVQMLTTYLTTIHNIPNNIPKNK